MFQLNVCFYIMIGEQMYAQSSFVLELYSLTYIREILIEKFTAGLFWLLSDMRHSPLWWGGQQSSQSCLCGSPLFGQFWNSFTTQNSLEIAVGYCLVVWTTTD